MRETNCGTDLANVQPVTGNTQTHRPDLKMLGSWVSDFDSKAYFYDIWEKEMLSLQSTYQLSDGELRMLIGYKVKGKALEWLHSKPEHITKSAHELLSEMKDMYDIRPTRTHLKKQYEGRLWKTSETFSEYCHEKVILGNKLKMSDEDLLEDLIDGIPNVRLRDQGRMQRFQSRSQLLKAF